MSAAHTPGPWLLGSAIDSPGMGPVAILDGAKAERCIAQVYPWLGADGNPDAQHDANARLIAAAPDLLALAKKYASECAECSGSGVSVTFGAPCGDCADIRRVIDKAEDRASEPERYSGSMPGCVDIVDGGP